MVTVAQLNSFLDCFYKSTIMQIPSLANFILYHNKKEKIQIQ